MSYRTGPGVPRNLGELWQFVRREFMSIERLYTRVEKEAGDAQETATGAQETAEEAATTADWSGVSDDNGQRPEDGATVGATNAERILIENSTGIFLDAFADSAALENWEQVSGLGEANVYLSGAAQVGGNMLFLGDMSGNDAAWLVSKLRIPFDQSKLYRLEVKAQVDTGSDANAALYLGAAGFTGSGAICSKDGSASYSNQHYVAANGVKAEGDGYVHYIGYIKGHGGSIGTNGARSIAVPGLMHPNVRYFAPLIIANLGATVAQTRVDFFRIDAVQVRDQKDLPHVQAALAGQPTSVPTTAVDAGSTARIDIAAHTVQYGFGTVSYNAGSISGLSFSTRYYIYCDDPEFEGGSVTYLATTSLATVQANTHRRYVDTITTPANGGGSTGGSTGPGGNDCVASGMWLLDGLRSDDAMAGDVIDLWDEGDSTFKGEIHSTAPHHEQPCVRITTASGAQVECSTGTPITDRSGRIVWAQHCLGAVVGVLHDDAPLAWEEVAGVEFIGLRTVYRIKVGGISYAAGVDAAHRVITHNPIAKP